MDLDKTWQRDGECGKSNPIKFLVRSLQKPHRRGKIPSFFCDEYHTLFGHFCSTDFC